MVRYAGGGDVDVQAGTGVSNETGKMTPLVQLTVTDRTGKAVKVHIRPLEARAIGLDLIGAAHATIADMTIREIARDSGLDGDGLIFRLRGRTDMELGPG